VRLEIRGVGGATAEEILGGPAVQTAGDSQAGFYRSEEADAENVEAYEWGRLTSGSRTSALWWILFPFTLINVAGWMFRPSKAELERTDERLRSSLWLGRLLIAVGGLAMTAAYVIWVAALTTEMVVFGCRDGVGCVDRWYMAPLTMFGEGNVVWLITCGIGLAALLILGLFLLILRSQDRLEGYETDALRRLLDVLGSSETSRLRRNTRLDDQAFWYKWAEHRRLFRWHLGLTMVLLGMGTGHALEVAGWTSPTGNAWGAIGGVLLLILLMLWMLTRPERFREAARIGEENRSDTGDRIKWLLTHVVLALIGAGLGSLLTRWLDDGDSPAFAFLRAVRGLSVVLYVAAGLMVILLALRKRQRKTETSWPTALMPGFAAALAIIVTGAGFAAVANLLGRFLLGAEWVAENGFDIVIVDLFIVSVAVTLLVAAAIIWRHDKPTDQVVADHFGSVDYSSLGDREKGWVDSVALSRVIADAPGRADTLLAGLTVVLLVLTALQFATGGFDFAAGPDGAFASPVFGIDGLSFFHTAAATATVLYLFPGVQLIRRTSKSRDSRRQLGKVWDVLSFWPRRFHPLAAPCYAERAVPEFRNRIREHLADGKRVVVSAHSQGTVIAFAALVQIAAENEPVAVAVHELTGAAAAPETMGEVTYSKIDEMVQQSKVSIEEQGSALTASASSMENIALVTFGSPLSSLYGPLFPWHFGTPRRLQNLRNRLADLPGIGRAWRSLWRPTDYIGQKVFIGPGGKLTPEDPDADVLVKEARRPLFPIESHSNYEREQQLQDTLSAFEDGLSEL
jgi:hypothetical protein